VYYAPPYPDEDNSFPGHSCAIRADGGLFCWGENGIGQLGDGTMTERHTPTQEVTHSIRKALAAGARLTCAIRPQGDLYCWGRGDLLGNGMNTSSSVPTQALFGGWISVSAGGWHVMGLRSGHD
jgi:alpha-tubulin suppressor-like RCC1 family protein